jgi:hypothetical protein
VGKECESELAEPVDKKSTRANPQSRIKGSSAERDSLVKNTEGPFDFHEVG